MLRKFLLAALLVLGFAAAAPEGASAAPVGPGLALPADAAPAMTEKAQYYYRRRFYGPRPYWRRPYYGRRFYYGPRPYYRRPYWRRRFYY
ncbi:hypothetical protein SAMN02799622_04926 [Methylobacterium sp. UNC378MF]|uniref:hypothetical protein n=1 Tax=unclassified Methylobacterium TaxID=2615210 RepID=UPI000888F58E|nr:MULTISPECIES: hypothetical protein [unclassified Methylobacterium]KAA0122093.1 hypothetical protein CIW48_20345 [Methylobacterium sp. P1-11]SDA31112.1 hypothetical protein SAMN02799622_04926 [Methylobacterium sp. UNC378MF]